MLDITLDQGIGVPWDTHSDLQGGIASTSSTEVKSQGAPEHSNPSRRDGETLKIPAETDPKIYEKGGGTEMIM